MYVCVSFNHVCVCVCQCFVQSCKCNAIKKKMFVHCSCRFASPSSSFCHLTCTSCSTIICGFPFAAPASALCCSTSSSCYCSCDSCSRNWNGVPCISHKCTDVWQWLCHSWYCSTHSGLHKVFKKFQSHNFISYMI